MGDLPDGLPLDLTGPRPVVVLGPHPQFAGPPLAFDEDLDEWTISGGVEAVLHRQEDLTCALRAGPVPVRPPAIVGLGHVEDAGDCPVGKHPHNGGLPINLLGDQSQRADVRSDSLFG